MHNWKTVKLLKLNGLTNKTWQYFYANYTKEHLFLVKTATALFNALNKTFSDLNSLIGKHYKFCGNVKTWKFRGEKSSGFAKNLRNKWNHSRQKLISQKNI